MRSPCHRAEYAHRGEASPSAHAAAPAEFEVLALLRSDADSPISLEYTASLKARGIGVFGECLGDAYGVWGVFGECLLCGDVLVTFEGAWGSS